MDGAADFSDVSSDLVDSYLLFLRGRGPEPDLTGLPAEQRRRVAEQFAIVAALADRAPALPPFDEDPVAIRLGLAHPAGAQGPAHPAGAADPAHPAGAAHPLSTATDARPGADDDPVEQALQRLELRFDRQVAVDRAPAWAQWHSSGMSPVAQCSALGNSVALFTTGQLTLTGEPDGVAAFLRQHPDLSAVCLSTPDATEAVLLTPADATVSLDPVRGWLEPGLHSSADLLEVTLGRYFEARLPHWERVAGFTELIELGDVHADAVAVAATTLAQARRTGPRLAHKREALAALKAIDASSIGDVVAEVQAGRLSGDALVSRLAALAGAVAS